MSQLSELLQANRGDATTRQLSERINGRLHFATVAAYLRGTHPERPDEATLQALADAFRLPLHKVQQAAGVGVGAGQWEPPAEAARLTRRQQAAVTEILMAMVETRGESWPGITSPEESEPPRWHLYAADEAPPDSEFHQNGKRSPEGM